MAERKLLYCSDISAERKQLKADKQFNKYLSNASHAYEQTLLTTDTTNAVQIPDILRVQVQDATLGLLHARLHKAAQ